MWIKNAKTRGKEDLCHIQLSSTKIEQILSAKEHFPETSQEVLDAQGGWVCPPFVEPHIHLDTALTAGEPRFNQTGSLFEGIAIWNERKAQLSFEDVKDRAHRALDLLWKHGVQFVRSHVDVTDPSLIALQALLEVKKERSDQMELQLIAFPQEGILSFPNGKQLLKTAISMGADGVGAIPHYEFQRDWGVESLRLALDLAEEQDCLVDVHCDEIDDEQSRFLEVLASEAHKRQMGPRVSASHNTAMGSYNGAYRARLRHILQLSGIHFILNPMVNTHLGGRFDDFPKRRGFAPMAELLEAGCNVCLGQDDLRDPWYPLGTGNPLDSVWMGLHMAHLLGETTLSRALDFITYNGALALSLKSYGLTVGSHPHLLVFAASSERDIVTERTPPRFMVRGGKVVSPL